MRRFCRTTYSQHPYGRYPNLVKGLAIVRPDQVWCARHHLHPACSTSSSTWPWCWTSSPAACAAGSWAGSLTEDLPKAALLRALRERRPEIHHSDQGVQYAADGYVSVLQAAGVQISMSAQGQPTQNAYAERFMRTLKDEEVYLHEYLDFDGRPPAHRALPG